MKRTLIHTALFTLLIGAFVIAPARVQAQNNSTNAPASTAPKKHEPRFLGYVTAVDLTAKTVAVSYKTYDVTSQTRIYLHDKPATLEDFKVGERVMGSYINAAGDKKTLVKISIMAAPPQGGAPATPPADTK
jgi:hypothetical protein